RVSARKHSLHGTMQAMAEIRKPGLDEIEVRNMIAEELLRTGRTEGHVSGDGGLPGGQPQIIGDVLEKCSVEGGRLAVSERGDEAGLRPARNRRLGHHGHTASCNTRACRRNTLACARRDGPVHETLRLVSRYRPAEP